MTKSITNNSVLFQFLVQKDEIKVISVGPSVNKLLGYTVADFIESKLLFDELIHIDDKDIRLSLFNQNPQQQLKKTNLRCRKANGKIICLQAHYQKFFDKAADTLKLELTLVDPRLLKQSIEEQLLTTNFTAMMDNTDDYIYFKDRNHVFTGASQTLVAITDPSESWEDLLGKTDYDVFPEVYANDYYRLEKQIFSGEIEVAHEVQKILDVEGNEGWVDNRKYPIKDKIGGIIGLFGIARDITENKRMEHALTESEQKFRTIFHSSPLGIATVDSFTGQIYHVNPAYVQIVGRSEEALKSIAWMDITHPDDVQESLDKMAVLNAGTISEFSIKNRLSHLKGEYKWVKMTIAPLSFDNKLSSRHLCMLEDITEQKQVNEELDVYRGNLEKLVAERTKQLEKARAKAESANVAKSHFLSNMSHEIRTPMNAIVGLTHLLQHEELLPEQIEQINKIESSTSHLLSIINDILDFSKIEAGKLILEQSDFDLNRVFDHITAMFKQQAHKRQLNLDVNLTNVPTWLHGDSTRLRQAIINFVSNAIKFSEHGTVYLSANIIEETESELLLRFEVRDKGIGIDKKAKSILFNAFEQADVSTTRKYGGTGLGLSITRQLAEIMGGEVGVDSQLGKGSTFWLTVKLKRGLGIQAIIPAVDMKHNNLLLSTQYCGSRILLVEDNAINLEVAMKLLKAVKLTVEQALNGREALTKVTEAEYDLVLMDVQMPEMDGLEATRQIRLLPNRKALPILAMTANVFKEDRQACIDAGMDDFIAKPIDPDNLYLTIINYLPKRDEKILDESLANVEQVIDPVEGNTELRRQLANIEGLDSNKGLRNMLNDEVAYLQLLKQFDHAHYEDMNKLHSFFTNNEIEPARGIAHTLKGTAGTLGIVGLQQAATTLDQNLRGQRYGQVSQNIDDIRKEQQNLHQALKKIITVESTVAHGGKAIEIVKQLKILLEKDDTAANELFLKNEVLLLENFGLGVKELGLKIEAFDYGVALEMLNSMTL